MGRPRAVSQADMTRAIAALKAAGVPAEHIEMTVEPGRVRIGVKGEVAPKPQAGQVLPREWPSDG